MKKNANWQIDIFQFIDKYKNIPFTWGVWDCCTFTDGMIQTITKETLIPKELSWSCKKTAFVAIKNYGGDLLKSFSMACEKKSIPEINKNYFTLADLCVYEGDEDPFVVGFGDGVNILGVGDSGIITKKTERIIKCWRIP